MKTRTLILTLVPAPVLLLNVLCAAEPIIQQLPKPAETRVDFARDIKPLLENSCLKCHGPIKPKSGNRVDSRDAIIKGGESDQAAIVPGRSEQSPLVQYIAGLVPDMEMPPLDSRDEHPPLTREQIALVRAWIDQGALWPEGVTLSQKQAAARATASTPAAESKQRSQLFAHIREGDTKKILGMIADRSLLQSRDEAGNTPLLQAALYLDATLLELLLKNGADPNATNNAGATALMKATGDWEKVRVLLDHGAKINPQSGAGNSALIIACRQHGAIKVVKELLARGADVNAATPAGLNALLAAAETGDEEMVAALLARGANANSTFRAPYSSAVMSALMVAAEYGHEGCVRLLLDHGADPLFTSEYGSALHFAASKDRIGIARQLIDRGVDVNLPGRRIGSFRNDFDLTPLMYAAMTEKDDPTLVELLLNRGAKVDAKTTAGETALGLAQKRGETKIVAALKAAGGSTTGIQTSGSKLARRWTQEQLEKAAVVQTAAESGLAILLQSGVRFGEATANRCVTCHQHLQPALAYRVGREKHFDYDHAMAADLAKSSVRSARRRLDVMLEEPLPVPSISAWTLIGLHAMSHRADELTDALAYSLARSQFGDGRWITRAARAPTDYSDVTSTALAIRALRLYSPPTMKEQFDRRIDRAASWLQGIRPSSTEERALQIQGLHWAGTQEKQLAQRTNELLQLQTKNGGWAQLPTLKSDAYATGLALYALHKGGGLKTSHPAYRKGIRFLLEEQLSDGSWYVETRASPIQVAVDGVFPHDRHQWISSSATTWSTLALMLSADARGSTPGE